MWREKRSSSYPKCTLLTTESDFFYIVAKVRYSRVSKTWWEFLFGLILYKTSRHTRGAMVISPNSVMPACHHGFTTIVGKTFQAFTTAVLADYSSKGPEDKLLIYDSVWCVIVKVGLNGNDINWSWCNHNYMWFYRLLFLQNNGLEINVCAFERGGGSTFSRKSNHWMSWVIFWGNCWSRDVSDA